MRALELLSPAANKEIAKEAIIHGADAVYIGATSHGARSKAANSIEDISEVVEFAHQFHVKVYVTVNTLVYDSEIKRVEKLVWELYKIGVDAIIVQDMSILRMNLPPIELHASTQCDTRTVEKALFLEKVGFSQLVLARELTLKEIQNICSHVNVPVECFVHGALCVSYSGRCQASEKCLGRSANRGECSQMCRLPYTLRNSKGEVILQNRYLLSLRDFNASPFISELIGAGVSSFKIEGRMKDADYVKNVTAAYRHEIDEVIKRNPDKYCRASRGRVIHFFTPELQKSFNRGFTDYFLNGKGDRKMASFLTPKSIGERITKLEQLNNGDGISFYNSKLGEYVGLRINKVEKGKIWTANKENIPNDVEIRRTYDHNWQKTLGGKTAERRIRVDFLVDETGVTVTDERGLKIRVHLNCVKQVANKPMNIRHIFDKLGNTIYYLGEFKNKLNPETFIPASVLTSIRREALEKLELANKAAYKFGYRRPENNEVKYSEEALYSSDNVANSLARKFYKSHGVKEIEVALEIDERKKTKQEKRVVMITRYCLRRELGCCKKHPKDSKLNLRLTEPLTISSGPNVFQLEFDCKKCEMKVIG